MLFPKKVQSLKSNAKLTSNFEIGLGQYWIALTLVFVIAIISQYLLFQQEFYSISADESAKALMANNLTWKGAIEPFVWPPAYKVLTGLALKVYDNLFITPRVIAFIFSLITLASLVFLAHRIFNDRLTTVIAAIVSVYIPHRFIFSVIPMSEMYFNCFILLSSAFLISWIKSNKDWQLTLTSIFLFLASTTRYEGCFFSLVLVLFLMYRFFVARQLPFKFFLTNVLILSAFPIFWIVNSWVLYGSLDNLSITKQQSEWYGLTYYQILRNNTLTRLLIETCFTPIIFGFMALVWSSQRDRSIRLWFWLTFLPVLLISFSTISSKAAAVAAPWRLTGPWILVTVPFLAFSIKTFATSFSKNRVRPALVAVVVAVLLTFVLQSNFIVENRSFLKQVELDAGVYLQSLDIEQKDQRILIETESYSYLNILTTSNMPEYFVLSTGDDPQQIALYIGAKDYIKQNDPENYQKYLQSKYDFSGKLDLKQLQEQKIAYLMLQKDAYQKQADMNTGLRKLNQFGGWNLYQLQE